LQVLKIRLRKGKVLNLFGIQYLTFGNLDLISDQNILELSKISRRPTIGNLDLISDQKILELFEILRRPTIGNLNLISDRKILELSKILRRPIIKLN
jgi:hypothetical protein